MSNIVCCIILGFFIILGITDVIKFLILKMFNPSICINEKSLDKEKLTLNINPENVEYIIRSIATASAWGENLPVVGLICSDFNDEVCKILDTFSKNYPYYKINE